MQQFRSSVHDDCSCRLTHAAVDGGILFNASPAAAPALEIYHNSPFRTHPDDLLTEIHVPLP